MSRLADEHRDERPIRLPTYIQRLKTSAGLTRLQQEIVAVNVESPSLKYMAPCAKNRITAC